MNAQGTRRGFTLIELMIVIAIIAIIAAIAIPNLLEARKASNESAAIGALRATVTAQTMYREKQQQNAGAPLYAASFSLLGGVTGGGARLVDGVLASGMKQGYRFEMLTATAYGFSAIASPQ